MKKSWMVRFSLLCFGLLNINCYAFTANPDVWKDIKHVVVIVLENTSADAALKQPFMNSLTKTGAYLSEFYAISHPSQPNYIAMIAGSRLGVTSDSNYDLAGKQLGDLFNAKGLTWKSYAEDYPGNCYLRATSGQYGRKHEPFLSFTSVQQNPAECAKVVPATQFTTDLAANKLPTFSFFVPNNNSNGHDTGVAFADTWLKNKFGPIFNNPAVMKDTLFIITFDEDDYTANNRVYTLFIGAGVKPGINAIAHYDHYDLLRTIEDMFALGNLGRNDLTATPILDIWKPVTPPPVGECLPPKNIQTSWAADKRSITIGWQNPDIATPIISYQISNWQNNPIWNDASLSFTDSTLPGINGMYAYYLQTNCSSGLSNSVRVDVTISNTPPPVKSCLAPANIKAAWTPDKRSVTLTWEQAANSAAISTFQVNNYANQFMWKGISNKFTDPSLPGTSGKFGYYLYSNCANGESAGLRYEVTIN